MEPRIDANEKAREAIRAMYGLGLYLAKSSVEPSLLNLIDYRVSQINGCAFCLDMHSKDLLEAGESGQRLFVLDAWREAPFYSDRERAALSYAEAVTKITEGHVSDEIFEEARNQFSEQEIIDLTMAVITINCYNRMNIAFRTTAGTYVPGQFAISAK